MKTNNSSNTTTTSTDSVTISRAQYEKFLALEAALQNTQSTNNMLQSRVNWLEQVLDLFKRNDFGSKSEKISKDMQEQIGRLFDEAELIQNVEKEAAATVEVKSHARQKKAKTSIWEHLPEGDRKSVV